MFRRCRFATALQKESARSGVQARCSLRGGMNATGLPCFGFNPGGAKILHDRMLTPLCYRTGWQAHHITADYAASIQSVCVSSPVGAMVVWMASIKASRSAPNMLGPSAVRCTLSDNRRARMSARWSAVSQARSMA